MTGCEHANECPTLCPCGAGCACRAPGAMCSRRAGASLTRSQPRPGAPLAARLPVAWHPVTEAQIAHALDFIDDWAHQDEADTLRAALAEVVHLRAQRTALQDDNTRLLRRARAAERGATAPHAVGVASSAETTLAAWCDAGTDYAITTPAALAVVLQATASALCSGPADARDLGEAARLMRVARDGWQERALQAEASLGKAVADRHAALRAGERDADIIRKQDAQILRLTQDHDAQSARLAALGPRLRRPQIGVGVIVRRGTDGRVLVGERLGAHGMGTHSVPGGHWEGGETVIGCAARELLEEAGIRVPPADMRLLPHYTVVSFDGAGAYVTLYVVCTMREPQVAMLMEPSKCAGWRWVTKEQLPAPLFAPLAELLTVHPNILWSDP